MGVIWCCFQLFDPTHGVEVMYYLVVKWLAPIIMDARWYSIGVEPSVYKGFGHCFCLLISCYYCHSKLEKVSIITRIFSFPSLLWSIFVKSKQSRSNGWLAIIDPCFTFGSFYGPLAFLHLLHDLTQLVTSWHIVLQKNLSLMIDNICFILSWPCLHGAVVALGSYKLLLVPTGDIWTPKPHKLGEVLLSWIPNDWIGGDTSWQSLIFLS